MCVSQSLAACAHDTSTMPSRKPVPPPAPRRGAGPQPPAAQGNTVARGLLWLQAAVFGHVRVKRQGRGVRVAFAETLLVSRPASPAQPASKAERRHNGDAASPGFSDAELALYNALGRALTERRGMRTALRQLAYLEDRLARRGFASLDSVAIPILARAHQQLALLCSDPKAGALVPLENLLSAVLAQRGVCSHLVEGLSPQERLQQASLLVAEGRLSDYFTLKDEVQPAG